MIRRGSYSVLNETNPAKYTGLVIWLCRSLQGLTYAAVKANRAKLANFKQVLAGSALRREMRRSQST